MEDNDGYTKILKRIHERGRLHPINTKWYLSCYRWPIRFTIRIHMQIKAEFANSLLYQPPLPGQSKTYAETPKKAPATAYAVAGLYKGGTKGGAGSNCEVSSPQTSQLCQTTDNS